MDTGLKKSMIHRSVPLLCLALAGCPSAPAANPASLWLDFSQREVNLVLVDHEPPPF
jgi:hypothetical protein